MHIRLQCCLTFCAHHLLRLLRLVLDVFDFAEKLLDGHLGLLQSLEVEKYSVDHVLFSTRP